MVAIILDGSEGQLETLADGSAVLIIFLVCRISTRIVNKVARLAERKLNEGGCLIVAEDIAAALEKVQ